MPVIPGMRSIPVHACGTVLGLCLLHGQPAHSETKNGFELDHGLISPADIYRGGPDKDGIPSIDSPVFIDQSDAGFLEDDDPVIGIEIDGTARAYPISILNWHEVVNDSIDDTYFTITFCPLCGTGIAFNSNVDGEVLEFGVSGLLYNSDVLLYDRKTESLWSQIMGKAVTLSLIHI